MKYKVLAIVLAICLLASLGYIVKIKLFSKGGPEPEAAIKLGVFEALTGKNGIGGRRELDGIKYANQVKPAVRIGDREYKVELVVSDNKSDRNEAVYAAQSLVDQGVIAVIGSYGSGPSITGGDVFRKAETPAIGASCTNPKVTLGNEYYFRVCCLDPFQGTVMATHAVQSGAKTVGILTEAGSEYSEGLGSFFANAFREVSPDSNPVVSLQSYNRDQRDFSEIMRNFKAAGPDVIFAPSSVEAAPLIIRQARASGVTAKLMGGDAWDDVTVIDEAGRDAEGITLSSFFDVNLADSSRAARDFVRGFGRYLAEAGKDPDIAGVSALGYDAYMVLLDAISRAGSTDGTAIRDAIAATEGFNGVTGIISFDKNGDVKKSTATIKTVKDGRFVFLKTVSVG